MNWLPETKDKDNKLEQTTNGWKYTSQSNHIETYGDDGKLITTENNNSIITFTFSGNAINRISSQNSNYIEFSNNTINSVPNRYFKITDNTGREWQFDYSNASDGNNLTSITYPDNTIKTFHYENSSFPHALTGITDRNGNRYVTFDYDAQGRVYHEQLAGGVEELTIAYNGDNTRTLTNSRGKVSTYTVARNNGFWQTTDIIGPGCSNCSNANTSFIYDPATNDLLSKTADGRTTTYGNYDAKGQYGFKIEAVGSPEQRQTNYTYDPRFFKKPLTIIEPSVHTGSNKTITYTYDDHANILSMTINGFTPDGTAIPANTTTYQYNGPYHQISMIDGPRTDVSDITVFEYYLDDVSEGDNRGRLKKLTNAVGIVLRNNIQYTPTGKILSEDKPNGLTTDYTYYAGNDRLETVANTDGTKTITTHMDYLASGEIKEIIRNYNTADASTLTLDYDDARRLTKVTDQQGNYVQYELDTEGNQLSEKTYDPSDTLKKTISQVFDDYDQVDTSTQSNVTNNMDYGSDGNLYQQTNGNNIVTDYNYDSLNRLTQITQDLAGVTPTGNTITAFEYDSNDRVSKVTDANNHDTLYQYDDLGRLVKLTSPDTGIDIFTYDEAGNVLSKQAGIQTLGEIIFKNSFETDTPTTPTSRTTNFTYDAVNRPTTIDYPDTDLDVTFVYDQSSNGLNQLTSFTSSKTTTNFTYDSFGNLTTKTQIVNDIIPSTNSTMALGYGFDTNNRLQTITYPTGLVVNYAYNNLNQVTDISTTINGQATNVMITAQYLPMGPLKSYTLGNGLSYASTYDNGYRLSNYQYSTTLSANYGYDNNHNITTISRETAANDANYGYDDLDRITNDSAESTVFTYDQLGNRTTSQAGAAGIIDYIYDTNSNQLLNVDNQATPREIDDYGNTLSTNNASQIYSYNQANRMQSYSTASTQLAEYYYNGIGQRIYKKYLVDNTHQAYVYNANGQLLAENIYDNTGALTQSKETIWLGNRPIAQVRTGATSEIYYILTDHLNTPRKVTNDSGTALWSWNSDAFGTTLANQDVDNNGTDFEFNFRFPGQYFDKESGKHYNYFRDYEPQTGRYLESDPIGLRGGINSYVYTLANPINYFDSDGQAVQAVLCGTPVTAAVCVCGAIIYYWGTSGNSRRSNNSFSMSSGGGRVIPFPGNPPKPRSCNDDDCDEDKEKRRKNCQAVKDSILATCAGLKGRKKFRCFHAADDAYDQCMED